MNEKHCADCRLLKPITEFPHQKARYGVYVLKYCKSCHSYRQKKSRNPELYADDATENPTLPMPYRAVYAAESKARMQAKIGNILEKYGDLFREHFTTQAERNKAAYEKQKAKKRLENVDTTY